MIKVVFPPASFQIKEKDSKEIIFDEIRKSWVVLTPSALIGIEKEIALGELKKRFDVLVYDTNHKPWMMIECKAMDVELSEKVLEQIVRYHVSVPVPYIVITNGSYTYAWEKKESRLIGLNELPAFE